MNFYAGLRVTSVFRTSLVDVKIGHSKVFFGGVNAIWFLVNGFGPSRLDV